MLSVLLWRRRLPVRRCERTYHTVMAGQCPRPSVTLRRQRLLSVRWLLTHVSAILLWQPLGSLLRSLLIDLNHELSHSLNLNPDLNLKPNLNLSHSRLRLGGPPLPRGTLRMLGERGRSLQWVLVDTPALLGAATSCRPWRTAVCVSVVLSLASRAAGCTRMLIRT